MRAMLTSLPQDVRLALRNARRAKPFFGAAILTLAIGMAGAAVMFTLIRGILLRPLPVADEHRLIVSWRAAPDGPTHIPYRADDVEEIGRESRTFESVAAVGYNGAFDQVWMSGDVALSTRTAVVLGDFFAVAGVRALLGRPLVAEDDRDGAERVIVLSHAAWHRFFAGSPTVLGHALMTNRQRFVIVGVMPADFEYPRDVEIWTSRRALASAAANTSFRESLLRDVEMFARLAPGVTVEQATGEIAATSATLDARAAGQGFVSFRPVVRRFKDVVVDNTGRTLGILFAAVGFLLLVATANVTNLLLMRGEARRREWVVLAALGAGKARLIRLHLAESAIVAAGALILALAVTATGLHTAIAMVPDGLPRLASIRVDATVIAFMIAMAMAVTVLAALAPAIASTAFDLTAALRTGARATAAHGRRGRRTLVVTQVALTVAVVAAAGLLVRSLQKLEAAEMGMAHDRLLLAELEVPNEPYDRRERRRQFHEAVIQRLTSIPGIDAATPINSPPFAGASGWDVPRFTAEGQSADEVAANPSLNFEAVHHTYFPTLAVPILRGRAFTAADREGSLLVAIVDRAMADRTWPGLDPLGRRVKFGGLDSPNKWLTVVGVAATTRYRELATPRPTLYVPAEQLMITAARFVIRSSADAGFVAAAVRDVITAAAPDVRVLRVAPYADYLDQPLAQPRFNALLLAVFAACALLLSGVGLYGVLSAAVRQRYGEIGVRLALGASTNSVRRLVVGEALGLAALGAVCGLVVAVAATRAMRSLLFEIEPLDPVSLSAAAALLLIAAMLAAILPARRATRVDPIDVLRAE